MNPKDVIHKSWYPIMGALNTDEKLKELNEKILPNISYQPSAENIFRVFSMPVNEIKVVILGQDPYPTPGDAIGYSFVNGRNKTPKSLEIIQREIEAETSHESQGIDTWTKQGIFLLNTALTVETTNAGSHLKYWLDFTRRVISFLSKQNPCIWLLWGKKAQSFNSLLINPFHVKGYDNYTIKSIPNSDDYNYVLSAPHPAAELYSGGKAGFYGCNHFKYVNEILTLKKKDIINW